MVDIKNAKDPKRDRGFLSQSDREFLRNRDDSDHKPQREYRIRKRFANALLDFTFLLETQSSEEVSEIIGPLWDTDDPPEENELTLGLFNTMEFVAGAYDRDETEAMLRQVLKRSYTRWASRRGSFVDTRVEFDTTIKHAEPLEEVAERYVSGHELSEKEEAALAFSSIDTDMLKRRRERGSAD
jgi:hypothetical protein